MPNETNDGTMTVRVMGRLGGLKGGPARAKALTAKRRQEIARMGANQRKKLKLIRESVGQVQVVNREFHAHAASFGGA